MGDSSKDETESRPSSNSFAFRKRLREYFFIPDEMTEEKPVRLFDIQAIITALVDPKSNGWATEPEHNGGGQVVRVYRDITGRIELELALHVYVAIRKFAGAQAKSLRRLRTGGHRSNTNSGLMEQFGPVDSVEMDWLLIMGLSKLKERDIATQGFRKAPRSDRAGSSTESYISKAEDINFNETRMKEVGYFSYPDGTKKASAETLWHMPDGGFDRLKDKLLCLNSDTIGPNRGRFRHKRLSNVDGIAQDNTFGYLFHPCSTVYDENTIKQLDRIEMYAWNDFCQMAQWSSKIKAVLQRETDLALVFRHYNREFRQINVADEERVFRETARILADADPETGLKEALPQPAHRAGRKLKSRFSEYEYMSKYAKLLPLEEMKEIYQFERHFVLLTASVFLLQLKIKLNLTEYEGCFPSFFEEIIYFFETTVECTVQLARRLFNPVNTKEWDYTPIIRFHPSVIIKDSTINWLVSWLDLYRFVDWKVPIEYGHMARESIISELWDRNQTKLRSFEGVSDEHIVNNIQCSLERFYEVTRKLHAKYDALRCSTITHNTDLVSSADAVESAQRDSTADANLLSHPAPLEVAQPSTQQDPMTDAEPLTSPPPLADASRAACHFSAQIGPNTVVGKNNTRDEAVLETCEARQPGYDGAQRGETVLGLSKRRRVTWRAVMEEAEYDQCPPTCICARPGCPSLSKRRRAGMDTCPTNPASAENKPLNPAFQLYAAQQYTTSRLNPKDVIAGIEVGGVVPVSSDFQITFAPDDDSGGIAMFTENPKLAQENKERIETEDARCLICKEPYGREGDTIPPKPGQDIKSNEVMKYKGLAYALDCSHKFHEKCIKKHWIDRFLAKTLHDYPWNESYQCYQCQALHGVCALCLVPMQPALVDFIYELHRYMCEKRLTPGNYHSDLWCAEPKFNARKHQHRICTRCFPAWKDLCVKSMAVDDDIETSEEDARFWIHDDSGMRLICGICQQGPYLEAPTKRPGFTSIDKYWYRAMSSNQRVLNVYTLVNKWRSDWKHSDKNQFVKRLENAARRELQRYGNPS